MKKVISGVLVAGTLIMSQASCIGSFTLTKKVYEWNQNVAEKWVNELVFLGFLWFQVYSVTTFIDAVILNSIEFWTGSNPMAMNDGDVEQQVVTAIDGKDYVITATKNKFDVKDIETGNTAQLVFNPSNLSWTTVANGVSTTILEGVKDANGRLTEEVVFHSPNGNDVVYDLNDNNIAQLQENLQSTSLVYAKN